MSLVSVKPISIYCDEIHESLDSIEINKDAILMIKKNYFPTTKEVVENGTTVKKIKSKVLYKIFFVNGDTILVNERDKHKLE